MKNKSRIITGSVVTLLVLAFVISSYSPTLAIRRHLLLITPTKALTCELKKSDFVDPDYGQQYTVDQCNGIYFAYVKKNVIGMYAWTAGGSGP